jgi:hypothetical protein
MYPKAVEAGIDADRFWSMTYDEIITQAEANIKIRRRELEEKAYLDYKASQLNAYAFNDPKKMPKFDDYYNFSKTNNTETSEAPKQQDWRIMKARMMERAAMIKDTKQRKAKMEEGG